MSEAKKHDGPYSLQESNSSAFCAVVGHDGKVAYPMCERGVAELVRNRLNDAYHAGRADILKQLGAGDWLPKVGELVNVAGSPHQRAVDEVTISVFDKMGNIWPLSRCKPYVRPLEVGETVRTFDGVIGRLLAVCDDVGVIWDAEHKVSVDEPIGKLTRAE